MHKIEFVSFNAETVLSDEHGTQYILPSGLCAVFFIDEAYQKHEIITFDASGVFENVVTVGEVCFYLRLDETGSSIVSNDCRVAVPVNFIVLVTTSYLTAVLGSTPTTTPTDSFLVSLNGKYGSLSDGVSVMVEGKTGTFTVKSSELLWNDTTTNSYMIVYILADSDGRFMMSPDIHVQKA